jgi:isoleucyl-tRNA synthetase
MLVSGVEFLTQNDRNILKEELNVKGVILQRASNQLTAKANFRTLGKKCGKDMPRVAKAIVELSTQELQSLQKGSLIVEGYQVSLEDVLITQVSDSEFPTEILDNLSVSLDTTLTSELIEEGDMRELCSVIQSQRKFMKLHMADRISLIWHSEDDDVFHFIKKWISEISDIVLANRSIFDKEAVQGNKITLSCGNLYFSLKKD